MRRLPYLLPFHFEESKRKLDGGPYSAVGWRLGKANSLAKVGGMTKAEISLACGLDAEKGVIGGRERRKIEEKQMSWTHVITSWGSLKNCFFFYIRNLDVPIFFVKENLDCQ